MKRMNVQQLISVGMAIVMAGQGLGQERRKEPVESAAPPYGRG